MRDQKIVILAIAALTHAVGCEHHCHTTCEANQAEPAVFYQPFTQEASVPESRIERPAYRLTPGDTLEVSYQLRSEPTERPYQVKIADQLRIVFPYQERFNQDAIVGGDGQIRCLLIGQVRAVGRTAAELEEQLKVAYGRYLKEPELTVLIAAGNVKIEELKKAITTAPRGQSRLIPVKPDGTIDLPYVGEVYVAGRTVSEAKKLIDQKYEENELPEVEVAVQASEFAAKRIYVHGEVGAAGVIEASTPITLVQALIARGGVTPRAEQSKVLLVRRKNLPIPEAVVFDLSHDLSETGGTDGNYGGDIYLADGDIVFVPSTALAKANDWIDQVFTRGIRAVVPYNGYVGMEFGYQVHNAPQPVKLTH